MEPYSSMDMMGIKSGDLLVAYDDTIATIYRAGGIKLRLKDIQCVQVEKGRYLTELEVMDWGKTKYGHVAHMTWDDNPFIYSKTQVYSDPEVSLYVHTFFLRSRNYISYRKSRHSIKLFHLLRHHIQGHKHHNH